MQVQRKSVLGSHRLSLTYGVELLESSITSWRPNRIDPGPKVICVHVMEINESIGLKAFERTVPWL